MTVPLSRHVVEDHARQLMTNMGQEFIDRLTVACPYAISSFCKFPTTSNPPTSRLPKHSR
jgi:hypothetical protein